MYQLGNTLRNVEHQKWPLALQMKNVWSSNECELYSVLVCKIKEKNAAVLTFDVELHISSRSSAELWKKKKRLLLEDFESVNLILSIK